MKISVLLSGNQDADETLIATTHKTEATTNGRRILLSFLTCDQISEHETRDSFQLSLSKLHEFDILGH